MNFRIGKFLHAVRARRALRKPRHVGAFWAHKKEKALRLPRLFLGGAVVT